MPMAACGDPSFAQKRAEDRRFDLDLK